MVTRKMIEWVNNNLPIEKYLEEYGVDIPPNGKVFCPFHHNVNTPAGKVYFSDQSGNGGRLYCYTERYSYTTFDVLRLCGYEDHDIHNLVPKEHWYGEMELKKIERMRIPVLDLKARDNVRGGPHAVLAQLEYMWDNPDKFKTRPL